MGRPRGHSDRGLNRPALFAGKILDIKFSGSVIDYEIEAAGHVLRVKHLVSQDDFKWTSGSEVLLKIDPSSIHFVTD